MCPKRPIALFIPALNCGGAQRVIVNLANALVDLTEHPVHVVLVRLEGEFLMDLRPEVCIFGLEKKRTLAAIPPLSRYLRSERPVVMMSRMNYANIAAALAWILAGRPCRLVLSEANVVRAPKGAWFRRMRHTMMLKLMRVIYPLVDCVVANSEATAQSMAAQRIVSKYPIVIHNPVLIPDVAHVKALWVPFKGFNPDRRLICAIGRLAEAKGFDCLLEAFAKLPDKGTDLVIVGEGPLREVLEKRARQLGVSDRVFMPGFVNAPTYVLEHSALFVLSSRWEGFGNVLVEALSSGVPIVSTDCPGAPRALLCDGALGHLVPVDDPDSLAQGITEAFHSPRGTRAARQERARAFAAPGIAREYLKAAFELEGRVRAQTQDS